MAHEAERAAHQALTQLCGAPATTPVWLLRPGKLECGPRWALVQRIYHELTGGTLPDTMPPRERRKVDGVFQSNGRPFIFELDETQHFNRYRAATLRAYPRGLPLAFDRGAWLRRCEEKRTLERGGWAAPRPPLFGGVEGRHRQRAFRDALADILPTVHGWAPTLRLSDVEVKAWMATGNVERRIAAELLRWYR